ncbi:sporulation protein YabP [Desulfofundulus thermobenzoicus]|uniref:Sporulation protein YabP n=1 Tax=Desulfofundulus thermobenzoicus TaxID=29376 RepID=A0A6N7IPF5_9FIRM|nr:sporulation protein YabP [Desulfofundulus thermobenzoicus]HHW43050.1 sporulation protein YabP [Desulfotomaculum sp.]
MEANQKLELVDRKHLVLEGVRRVESFDEKEITLDTAMGFLTLKGEGLHITHLDLQKGNLSAEGRFTGFWFTEAKGRGRGKGTGLMKRLLK